MWEIKISGYLSFLQGICSKISQCSGHLAILKSDHVPPHAWPQPCGTSIAGPKKSGADTGGRRCAELGTSRGLDEEHWVGRARILG